MKILVTGINGQVGWELNRQAAKGARQIIGLDRVALDITDHQAVGHAVACHRPDLLINCAAYTAVDRAEEEEELAQAVNGDGPARLAEACRPRHIPLIHLSTDYVFDGTGVRPYLESDAVAPLGVYGRSKERGERRLREVLPEHVILRTSWVYGVHGHNFVKTMLRLARQHRQLKVVAYQWRCPTAAADLAGVLLTLADRIAAGTCHWGTYHCCGATVTTWHGFAEQLFALCQGRIPLKVEQVLAIASADYPTPAKRPAYSVLDCGKLAGRLQITMPPLVESLAAVVDELAVQQEDGGL